MSDQTEQTTSGTTNPISFKAETRQLLDILIHSLYTEREIFLRELISNASDALTRMNYVMLTNRDVLDPDAELCIRISADPNNNILTISDSGVGMTAEELVENLGTIAHSGAKAFMMAAQEGAKNLSDIIGQFGVGFYSAFMVAEWIKVTSRSYQAETSAASWYCTGNDTFTVEPAQKIDRGTRVEIKLKEDAKEFTQESQLREVIRKHSDFISFPIYLGENKEQVNKQTALWRQQPRKVEIKDYEEFYHQLTLDFSPPLTHLHLSVDAPVQMYAILYVPAKGERSLFSIRKEDGLKLYSCNVLIQEYCKEVLPEYYRFIQGVVDSEDLPLSVSRETIQANRIMVNLKSLITSKVTGALEKMAKEKPETYMKFWEEYGRYIKEGVAIEQTEPDTLYPLLRFHTSSVLDKWSSLDKYIERMKAEQKEIYYILGDDDRSVIYSPHLDIIKKHSLEVLLLTDPIDPFMLVRLTKYKDHPLVNVSSPDIKLPPLEKEQEDQEAPSLNPDDWLQLVDRFKQCLGEKVSDVRMTDRLSNSPARLVDPEGAPNQEMQRVYRLLKEDIEIPKKVLELNPRHPILVNLNAMPAEDDLSQMIIEQVFEDALLIEGLHPDPAGMIERIQKIIQAAIK
ncbi:MAG: molecular chaperone HtpG [Anaerolineales bacterium]|nr:MAG: molecular chaperone HtpG [Anaerolineales bacterium]